MSKQVPPFLRSYYIVITNTYFKFDDLEGILGKISKAEEGCQKNRHYDEIYRHLGKKILGTFSQTAIQNQETTKLSVVNSVFKI